MNVLTPLAVRIGAIPWLPRLLPQITAVDSRLQDATSGRWSVLRLAGLPNIMLTVPGRRSGVPRSTPLLAVPWRSGVLIAGSNFGGSRQPAWVLNVRAADAVGYTRGGMQRTAVPRELTGTAREEAWAHMLATWPNFAKYAERTDRLIPVFFLEPTD